MSKTWTTETIHYLTATQMRVLLGYIASAPVYRNGPKQNKRDFALFLIAYRHGLRASEVGLLRVADLDLTHHRIKIHRLKKSLSGEHPMQPDEVKAIKAYLRWREYESPYLFTSNRRAPISRRTLDVLMKTYGAAVKLPEDRQHFHVLKHSIATHLLSAGGDLAFVRDWLGHASIKNTLIYAQLVNKKRDEEAQRVFLSSEVV